MHEKDRITEGKELVLKTQLKADLMLTLVTLCWGASYYLMDVSLQEMGAFTLNAFRFFGAFLIALVFSLPRMKHISKQTFLSSAAVGAALYFVYIGATMGVLYTSLSNAAFLCAMTVIFVPFIEIIVFHKKPSAMTLFAVAVSFVGVMLLTLKDDFGIDRSHLRGDLLSLFCALFYAVDLIITEKAVAKEEVDAYQLGVLQLGFTGIFMLLTAVFTEDVHAPASGFVWFSVLFLTVFCTGIAFIVQAVAQQYTTATHVGLIFTLEPVFAAVVAFFIAGEVLSVKSYIGAALMLGALLLSELAPRAKRERPDK